MKHPATHVPSRVSPAMQLADSLAGTWNLHDEPAGTAGYE
ncbi:hypothetical protein MXAN_5443 [Myxococcus xanthus DK 1622]|uniref:Uncharacterized protein n=1 Tax=Myxococcus xanthus (strain DK1622) TaxID=246197 RepID=Q1D186_MYXXD|nr:hypothetical protein MXAN_5443 [Myxococcus xanthus DK 1622]